MIKTISAFIKAKFQYGGNEITVPFPITESMLSAKLTELHAPSETSELFLTEIEFPTELKALENTFVNIDELNFLGKRMEGFCEDEDFQLFEAMKLEGFTRLKDIINLSFNLDKYTLIQNIGDMQKVGVEYTLNARGSLPTSELNDPKYADLGRKLLRSGEGIFTEHGLLFKDRSRPFEELYDGQVFPAYVYDSGVIAIAEAKYNGKTEYIYLPCESRAIDKALRRLGADSADHCEISLKDFSTGNSEWLKRMTELCHREGIYEVNRLAKAVSGANMDYEKLSAVAEYANAESVKGLIALAENLDDFVFIKYAEDYETVGRYFADSDPKYDLNVEMEDFFDYEGFGEYMLESNGGEFTPSGFVCMLGGADLYEILDCDEDMTMEDM